MKQDLHACYKGLRYEEGFDPSEVFSFHHKKRHINNHVIINSFEHSERQKFFGEDRDMGVIFFNQVSYAFANNMNHLSQLRKALELANEHGPATGLSIPTLVSLVIAGRGRLVWMTIHFGCSDRGDEGFSC